MNYAENVRKICRATLERLGVASGTAFFPDLERKAPALFFRYRDGLEGASFPPQGLCRKQGLQTLVLEPGRRVGGQSGDRLHHRGRA